MNLRLLSAFLGLLPTAIFAGPVELTSLDGTLTVQGDLVSVEGEFFRVETAYGALTLDGGNLRCKGDGCPDPQTMIARARIGGPTGMIHGQIHCAASLSCAACSSRTTRSQDELPLSR